MNKMVYKFLLAGDRFMPEMHLRRHDTIKSCQWNFFNFVFGLFFEQKCLLNLIILGVYPVRWPESAGI